MSKAAARIPFDSFTLSAVVAELEERVGGKIQDIRQPNEWEIHLGIYAGGTEARLLISAHPVFARAHLTTRRVGNPSSPPQFVTALRSRLDGARLREVRQIAGDRILELVIETETGMFRLIAEIMGKHSNVMLVDAGGRVVGALHWVGRTKSRRPIQPNAPYALPPVMRDGDGHSPFYRRLAEALGHPPKPDQPVLVSEVGAYPCSVASLGFTEHARASISIALEQHYAVAIPAYEADAIRSQLRSQLERVVFAREVAIEELAQAEAAGGRAPEWQRKAELILAYGPGLAPGAATLDAWDYDGTPVQIPVDPALSFKENAERFFDRAKRAKGRLGMVRDQLGRLRASRDEIQSLLVRVEAATRLNELVDLREEARQRRLLQTQAPPTRTKEERPYEGHRVRELTGPGGWPVLYGENAEANDYLTLRVAKPNDLWLHIRGATSAHVVVVTRNQPERVQRDTLEFAAKVAVQNSPSKHAGYVAVDYTLKKYVRKPRGAAKGTALYTHEKTLHVES